MERCCNAWIRYTISSAICALFGALAPASANTLHVASNGVDSGSCGGNAPCRSIGQAIVNSSSGDTISVGPGIYGDINHDNFAGAGDEHPDPNAGLGNVPNMGCVVCITKSLHIYSSQGAATTVIANDPQSPYGSTVMILSPGVDFGTAGHGFTLMGSSPYGVLISLGFPVLENISVAGNIDNGDGTGFAFYGYPYNPHCSFEGQPGADCRFPARILFANNQAVGDGTGFNAAVNHSLAGPIIFKDNVSFAGGTGFAVGPGGCCTDEDGGYGAGQVQLVNNVAVGAVVGFSAGSVGPIEYNTALNNSQTGFIVTPGAPFHGNSAIGNAGPGVIVNLYDLNDADDFPEPITSAGAPFSDNNFIGNDRNRPTLSLGYGVDPGPSAHCGILVGLFFPPTFPFYTSPPVQLAAADNYWGASTGPSPTGPADAAGGVCAQHNGSMVTTPFSKTPFAVSSNP